MQARTEIFSNLDILQSSLVSAALTGLCTNFLEVTKTRIMVDSVNCQPEHLKSKSLIKRYFQSSKNQQKIRCRPGCLPSTN